MDDLKKLKVFHASGATYTDRTEDAFDFLRDDFTINLVKTTDFLYIGRDKAFNAVFTEINTTYPNAVTTSLTAEYWNGTAWTALPLLVEDTKAFKRSGFIKWTTPETTGTLLWAANAVNLITKFWVRFQVADTITATTKLRGINLVFADDQDLKREDYSINTLLPQDENGTAATSHIQSHVAAREAILERVARDGKVKTSSADSSILNLDQWDFLNIGQIREAATFKALAKIYLESSDNPQDVYWAKYTRYESLYEKAMDLYILSLDTDDDGVETDTEKASRFGGGTFRRS